MVTIYGLLEPDTRVLRYVGKTKDSLTARLERHMRPSHLKPKTKKNCWLRSLGVMPLIEAIEIVKTEDASEAERFWIAYFHLVGAELTNGTAGGEGGSTRAGQPVSQETRDKMSATRQGRPSPRRGVLHDEEARDKMRKPKSLEHKAKISAALKGRPSYPRNKFGSFLTKV